MLEHLGQRAQELVGVRVRLNDSVTLITVEGFVNGQPEKKVYPEPAFSGCGAVWFALPQKDWRLAKSLGFEKGYKEWTWGRHYYNGQFGDATAAYRDALEEFSKEYPGTFLDKMYVGSWID